MKLMALRPHRYYQRRSRTLYQFSQGEEREVPEEVGRLLLKAHPHKFVLVEGEPAGQPVHEGIEAVSAVENPPQHRMVRRRRLIPSPSTGEG